MKKRVSLVLGSGGARGLAHVGIIRWLEENGYKIESISGCSIGALIGGFYAAGKLDIYVEWLQEQSTFSMLQLLDFKGIGGLVSGDTLMKELKKIVGDYNIEDLPIKFTAVATNIESEKEIWISKGSLLAAIRASTSLPLFFAPFYYKGRALVDGGVLNPVPIAPTVDDDTDITIAVNLGAESSCENILPEIEEFSEKEDLDNMVQNNLAKILLPEHIASENSMYMVANKSFESMQGTIAKMKLAAYPADIEIDIPTNLCGTFEFNRSKEMIEYGYNKCQEIMG